MFITQNAGLLAGHVILRWAHSSSCHRQDRFSLAKQHGRSILCIWIIRLKNVERLRAGETAFGNTLRSVLRKATNGPRRCSVSGTAQQTYELGGQDRDTGKDLGPPSRRAVLNVRPWCAMHASCPRRPDSPFRRLSHAGVTRHFRITRYNNMSALSHISHNISFGQSASKTHCRPSSPKSAAADRRTGAFGY